MLWTNSFFSACHGILRSQFLSYLIHSISPLATSASSPEVVDDIHLVKDRQSFVRRSLRDKETHKLSPDFKGKSDMLCQTVYQSQCTILHISNLARYTSLSIFCMETYHFCFLFDIPQLLKFMILIYSLSDIFYLACNLYILPVY